MRASRATVIVDDSQGRDLTQQLHRSTGSYELVLSPVILGVLGYFVDSWLGTTPVITVVAVLLGLVGAVIKIYYGYEAEMAEHEKGAPWAQS